MANVFVKSNCCISVINRLRPGFFSDYFFPYSVWFQAVLKLLRLLRQSSPTLLSVSTTIQNDDVGSSSLGAVDFVTQEMIQYIGRQLLTRVLSVSYPPRLVHHLCPVNQHAIEDTVVPSSGMKRA